MTGKSWAILIIIAQFAFIAREPTLSLQTKRTSLALPRIDILYPPYGTIFDRTCSQFLKGEEISSEWIAEAGRRPEFRCASIQGRVRSTLVIIVSKIAKLGFKISCGPKERLIEILSANGADQSLHEWMR